MVANGTPNPQERVRFFHPVQILVCNSGGLEYYTDNVEVVGSSPTRPT